MPMTGVPKISGRSRPLTRSCKKRRALNLNLRAFIKDDVKLKNSLILMVICLGAWQFYFKENPAVESSRHNAITEIPNSRAMQTVAKAKAVFKCDGRQHCSQMKSYEEAIYFIQHCPNTKMDGDNDGVPCERQFNR